MLAKVGKSVIKNADPMEMIENNSCIEQSIKVSGLFAGLDRGKLPQDLNPIISMVYHSHNDSARQCFKRSFDMSLSFKEISGAHVGLFSIPLSVLGGVVGDWKFMRKSKFRGKARWLVYSAITHASRSIGWWLGTHHKRFPKSFKRRVSMVPHMFR